MKLLVDWTDFENKVNKYIAKGNEMHNTFNQARTDSEFENLSTEIKNWIGEVHNYLKTSFDPERNEFACDFYAAKNQRFSIPGTQKAIHTVIRECLEDLSIKISILKFNLKLISACDKIVKPEETELEARKKYNVNQVLEFLLNKLYDLFDDNSYPIINLLTGNGVELKSQHEERELATALENRGLVEQTSYGRTYVRLTVDGRLYVEQMRSMEPTDYSQINQVEVSAKLDEIMSKLRELGFGEQVIFDELEELRSTNGKLDKRSWGQLLKGKLYDLVSERAIDSMLASEIFKELTSQVLQLK